MGEIRQLVREVYAPTADEVELVLGLFDSNKVRGSDSAPISA